MVIGLLLAALILSLPSVSDAADAIKPSKPSQTQSQKPKTGQPQNTKVSQSAKPKASQVQKSKPSQARKPKAGQKPKTAQGSKQVKGKPPLAKAGKLQKGKAAQAPKQKTTQPQKPKSSQVQKPQTAQPRAQTAIPDSKPKPVAFRCFASAGEGVSDLSTSSSVKVEGSIGRDGADISLSTQERSGGKVLSRYNWTGSIKGRQHASLVQLASDTRFRDEKRDGPKKVGDGYSFIEVTLKFQAENELTGTPVNSKGWKEFLGTIKETAFSKKSERVTGLRCYMPHSVAGAGEVGPAIASEMECSIGSSNTILIFGTRERSGGRLQPVLQWSGQIDGELHRRLVQTALTTRLNATEEEASEEGGPANQFEITLRYPDGERTGTPSNPEAWKEILHEMEDLARGGKKQ